MNHPNLLVSTWFPSPFSHLRRGRQVHSLPHAQDALPPGRGAAHGTGHRQAQRILQALLDLLPSWKCYRVELGFCHYICVYNKYIYIYNCIRYEYTVHIYFYMFLYIWMWYMYIYTHCWNIIKTFRLGSIQRAYTVKTVVRSCIKQGPSMYMVWYWVQAKLLLVGGLEHFYFPISWECHHPNWRNHMFQMGRLNHQPDWVICSWTSWTGAPQSPYLGCGAS